ncbi:MAG: cystathionine beta-lyase [Pseudomonadota bacterium]
MKDETKLIHTRSDRGKKVTVNPPIERASTVLFSTRDTLYGDLPTYGRMGLTVHRELEAALCLLENATYTKLTANGLQACALAIASSVKAGDHILIADSIYGPTRRFCQRRLHTMGIEATRFSPIVGADIAALVQPNTKAILLESPGSLTFDVMDTPAIVELARGRGLTTIMDNTWGAGVLHKPLDFGIDISIQALTKYAVGHADTMGGAVMTNSEPLTTQILNCSNDWGISLSPDDAYMALRGLRSLTTRLSQHERSGYTLARWLQDRPEVADVLHPGLETHPEHAIWQRDFTGANGLFGIILNEMDQSDLDTFLEAMTLFGMGFSWGGYESLLIPCCDQLNRLKDDRIHDRKGPLLRMHVGLEDPDDLIQDLDQAFHAIS